MGRAREEKLGGAAKEALCVSMSLPLHAFESESSLLGVLG
ncbi:hypothetical protein MPNT_460002 [Candidatus Methylacidithermus pantelleriae]|uniref:Uncharacterized protein n=1 Tax=Candidatus Methylacidithermus pantelleriae TaxID=2744239 RepID=A0A8J2BQH7_9BACT|nr:hypothetical protein MPNT_460002 [Candidatus Methylacidithermus pantelleriae]